LRRRPRKVVHVSAWDLNPQVGRDIVASSRSTMGAPQPGMFEGMMSAVGRAFPAAYNEAMSAITGVATEYGRAAALTHGATPAQSVELMGSPAPIADQYRAQAKALIPDPLTTGAASRVVFDATRVLVKAGAAGAVGGIPLAVGGTGVLEGTIESQNLRDKGVDAITAAKVGAIRGISTGIGLALPIAGRTLLETAGLVIAGGPVSFMAEKAAARAVLEHADYSGVALEYDPFDPAGLALSVAVPGIFGAAVHAGRAVGAARGRARPSVSEDEVDAARAVQIAQHVDETRLSDPGNARAAEVHVEALASARAQLDAGERVSVAEAVPLSDIGAPGLTAAERMAKALERQATRGDDITLDPERAFRPGTPAADMDGSAALTRAGQIVGVGRLGELTRQASAELNNFLELTQQRRATPAELAAEAEHVARQVVEQKGTVSLQAEVAAVLDDPEIRAEIMAMRGEGGWAEQGGNLIRDPVTGEVSGRTAWVANAEWWPGRPDGLSKRAVERAVDKAIAGDKLTAAEGRTVRYMADYARERLKNEGYEPRPKELEAAGLRMSADEFDAAMVARALDRDPAMVEAIDAALGHDNAAFMRGIKEFLDESDATVDRGGEGGAREEGAREGAQGSGEGADPVAAAAKTVVDEVPDMRVFDEVSGETVTAAELMRRAEEAYEIDARESASYGAAVECFLRAGA
jgi:hypothetical protein